MIILDKTFGLRRDVRFDRLCGRRPDTTQEECRRDQCLLHRRFFIGRSHGAPLWKTACGGWECRRLPDGRRGVFSRTAWNYFGCVPAVTSSITWSRLKLPGFCRGGNSLKLCSHCADDAGGRRNHEHAFGVPLVIAETNVLGLLERIHAQVGKHRRAHLHEWLLPDAHTLSVLAQEGRLPVAVAERRDAAIVGPVDEILARPRCSALERRPEVVAVEMHLVSGPCRSCGP